MMRPGRGCALPALLLSLAGCAGGPRPAEVVAPGPEAAPAEPAAARAEAAALAAFQARQRTRARQAQAEGRFGAAQQAWATVLALAPADAEASSGHALASESMRAAASDRMRRAEQARARGDGEAAMRLFLEALAQDPTLQGPPEALRALERERTARAAPRTAARAYLPAQALPELEHAELLADSGELDAAITLLEPLALDPGADAGIKRKTCEWLLRRAAMPATPRATATAAVERCLRLLPQHAAALQLRARLRATASGAR